ncbi:hypothetical protein, partial [Polyangium fumosum]|uniref:hypothetical protein n=1 Tax=Polyangium fumosum TaxID=889272 RepID=UPI001B875EE0
MDPAIASTPGSMSTRWHLANFAPSTRFMCCHSACLIPRSAFVTAINVYSASSVCSDMACGGGGGGGTAGAEAAAAGRADGAGVGARDAAGAAAGRVDGAAVGAGHAAGAAAAGRADGAGV